MVSAVYNNQACADRDLLLGCLRLEEDAQKTIRLSGYGPEDWEDVFQRAEHDGVLAYLYWRLKPLLPYIHLPDVLHDKLRTSSVHGASQNVLLYHELTRVLQALAEAHIQVVVLKGVHLAALVYEDISLRRMNDMDLLIARDRMEACDTVMQSLGYGPTRMPWIQRDFIKAHHHLPPYWKVGSFPIEIHWTIANPESHIRVDPDILRQRARAQRIANVPVLVLSAEDLLIHLCIHACYQDRFETGLRAIIDVCETLRIYKADMVWEQVVERALDWKAHKGVYLTLYLTKILLGAPVPESVLTSLYPEGPENEIIAWATEKLFGEGNVSRNYAVIWGNASVLEKARLLWRRVFLPLNALSLKYSIRPDSPYIYFYYLVRFKDLLLRYSGDIWHERWRKGESVSINRDAVLADWLLSD